VRWVWFLLRAPNLLLRTDSPSLPLLKQCQYKGCYDRDGDVVIKPLRGEEFCQGGDDCVISRTWTRKGKRTKSGGTQQRRQSILETLTQYLRLSPLHPCKRTKGVCDGHNKEGCYRHGLLKKEYGNRCRKEVIKLPVGFLDSESFTCMYFRTREISRRPEMRRSSKPADTMNKTIANMSAVVLPAKR